MNLLTSGVVKAFRTAGQSLDNMGKFFEISPHEEKLLPSTRAVKFGKHIPQINASFLANSATVIGNVKIGPKSSVWYGAVIRGDTNSINIGDSVYIGDRVMVHVSGTSENKSTSLGNNIIIEAGSILHGCTLEDNIYIGHGTQVLDGAVIKSKSMVEAGSIVTQGKTIPSGQLWSGVPAKYVRNLSNAEIEAIDKKVEENYNLALIHQSETVKSWQEIDEDLYVYEQTVGRNPDYYKRLTPEEMSYKKGEVEGHRVPGRLFDTNVVAKEDKTP